MSKPKDIPQDIWEMTVAVEHGFCVCHLGQDRNVEPDHTDRCWRRVEAHARAIMAERERCADKVRDEGLAIAQRVLMANREDHQRSAAFHMFNGIKTASVQLSDAIRGAPKSHVSENPDA